MKVREVKQRAERWVLNHAASLDGFEGAFYRGSVTEADDGAEYPTSSDLDMALVFSSDPPDGIGGETIADGIAFGPACWPLGKLQPLDAILGDYRIAHSFRQPFVLPCASDQLNAMAEEAAREFPKPHRVARRLADARANCLKYIGMARQAASEVDRALMWLWAAGITTHIILVAGLRNPTVRKRYLAAREVLSEFSRLDSYESLLALQGSQNFDRPKCQTHLGRVTELFEIACRAGAPPYPFSHDICPAARPRTIDGTRELIDRGDHREAVFWLVATSARSLVVLDHFGATELAREYRPCLDDLLYDLGIGSGADLLRRVDAVEAAIPAVMRVADEITAAHPRIDRA